VSTRKKKRSKRDFGPIFQILDVRYQSGRTGGKNNGKGHAPALAYLRGMTDDERIKSPTTEGRTYIFVFSLAPEPLIGVYR
jgi:hypothetical protein